MSDSDSINGPTRMDTIDEVSLIEFSENNPISDNVMVDKKRRQSIIPLSHQPESVDTKKKTPDFESNNRDIEDAASFDTFILDNFNPFSGSEDVIDWLDTTDKNFNLHKISRHLRFAAVPLLVEGEAKRKYIRNRNNIKSFDDFYEFLLTTYDVVSYNRRFFKHTPSSHSFPQNNMPHNSLSHRNITFEDQSKVTSNNFDLTNNLPPRPILRSTALVDIGTTKLSEDPPETRSTITPSSNMSTNISNLDQTTYVIHKALIDNLIKKSKNIPRRKRRRKTMVRGY